MRCRMCRAWPAPPSSSPMRPSRAENLSPSAIAGIVHILDDWNGKLNWTLLIDAVEMKYRSRYTRQALHRHEAIYHAYLRQKEALLCLPRGSNRTTGLDTQQLIQRLEKLEGENLRLTTENQRLMEQQVRFIYNAHVRGIDKGLLNQALPPVNRSPTKREPVRGPLKIVPK